MIVDDHEIVRAGLQVTLETATELEIVAVAATGQDALNAIKVQEPDVLITDLRMPGMDGIELMSQARELYPDLIVLLLTVVEDARQIREVLDAGASGYLLKTASAAEIVGSVQRALAGSLVVSPEVGSIIAAQLVGSGHAELSAREAEVLQLVALGQTNSQIAASLFVGETTVRTHLRRAFAKLGAQDRTSAVTEALKRGFISLDESGD